MHDPRRARAGGRAADAGRGNVPLRRAPLRAGARHVDGASVREQGRLLRLALVGLAVGAMFGALAEASIAVSMLDTSTSTSAKKPSVLSASANRA